MANSAILSIRIVGDATNAVREFQKTQDRAQAMQRGFERAAQLSVVALAGITAAAVKVTDAASGLSESVNAVDVTFGKHAEGIKRLGEQAAESVGLSNEEFNGFAVQFSSFAESAAGAGGDVVGTMDDLTTRVADFASVMNLEVPDAAAKFQSGLAGETEPLRQFGIDLSAAAVENYALANGIAAAGDALTEEQKIQARYGLLMEETAKTAGDFENTQDGLANSTRVMEAQWKDAQAQLGEALLPVMTDFVGILSEAAQWADENVELVQLIVGVLGSLAAALVVARGAQIAMNIAMAANPIGLIITAIGLLIAGVVAIITHWDELKVHLEPIFTWFEEALANIGDWIQSIVDWLAELWNGAKDFAGGVGDFFTGQSATVAMSADTSAIDGLNAMSTSSLTGVTSRIGSTSAPAQRAGDTYKITVNGALDVDGTARTLEDILGRHGSRTGRPVTSGGTRWR